MQENICHKMKEYKVNQYLSLRLEYGKTFIYIKGERFIQCLRLVLQIPQIDTRIFDTIDSIDEATEIYDTYLLENQIVKGQDAFPIREMISEISPKEEFWGHCSNLQTWVEYDYDSRVLRNNLAFPLLKKLTDVGDPLAKKIFKEEIATRIESGSRSVILFLINGRYLDSFRNEELNILMFDERHKLKDWVYTLFSDEKDELKDWVDINSSSTYSTFQVLHKIIKMGQIIPLKEIQALTQINRFAILMIKGANLRAPWTSITVRNNHVEYFGITALKEFELSSDQLEIIGELKHLKKFNLSNIKLDSLPITIGNLSQLERIHIENGNLEYLPKSIVNLKKLNFIRVSRNKFRVIPEELYNLKGLESLQFADNKIHKLDEDISKLTSLKWLFLSRNYITTIPNSIKHLTLLEKIELSYNPISSIPESILELPNLKEILLHGCNINVLKDIIEKLRNKGVKVIY